MSAFEVPTLESLAIEVATLRAELALIRREVAAEVRTRRLVVVDEDGAERVSTRISDTLTILEVEAPPNGNQAAVQLAAAWDEGDDDEGRPIGHSCVSVSTKGFPGAQLLAIDIDGGPAYVRNPVTGVNEQQPTVEGRVWVFDEHGNDGAQLSASTLRFQR
ncbi:hypothetical protein BH10ACT1_BH10ACT1_33460 [soil metagenome]